MGRLSKDNTWFCDEDINEKRVLSSDSVFEVDKPGTYAVIFLPNVPLALISEDVFCGALCENKRLVFIYIFVILPTVFVLLFFSYKM